MGEQHRRPCLLGLAASSGSALSPPPFLLAWVRQEPMGAVAHVLNLPCSGDRTFFPYSLLILPPSQSAEHGVAAAAFSEGNLWAAAPGGIHPARIAAPLWEHLPRAPRS